MDALNDELALDTDTSYLEEVSAPKVPTKEPGADSVNTVILQPTLKTHFDPNFSLQDGQLVDEFGLPKLPAT